VPAGPRTLSQGLGASLRHVGILAAAMFMVQIPAFLLFVVALKIFGQLSGILRGLEVGLVPGSLLAVTALAAAWCGRRWLVAASVVAAVLAAVSCLVFGGWQEGMVTAIAAGLSLALTCALLWLLRHRARTAPPTTG
jgi:hypothetical protein